MRTITLILIGILPFIGFGQEFNELDEKGRKTGYWKTFLDNYANPTDSANASFWGFEYYHEGKIVGQKFRKSKRNKYNWLETQGMQQPVKGKPVMLNGVLRWHYTRDGQDQIFEEDTFENGFALTLKEFTNNELTALMDFTKKYQNLEGSCYIIGYYKSEVTQCRWYRKIDNKWKSVKTICE